MKYRLKYGKEVFECKGPDAPEHLVTLLTQKKAAERDYMLRNDVPGTHYDYENYHYLIQHENIGDISLEFEILED